MHNALIYFSQVVIIKKQKYSLVFSIICNIWASVKTD